MYKKACFISIILLVITGCTFEKNKNSDVFLLESTFNDKSKLVLMNKDLNLEKKITINEPALEHLVVEGNDKVQIPASYTSKMISVSDKEEVSIHNSNLPNPLFYLKFNVGTLTIYNYDKQNNPDYYTYEFKYKKREKLIKRIKGIPFNVASTEDKAYVFSRDMNQEIEHQFSIIEIDLKTGTILNNTRLDEALVANDMQIVDNTLYIALNNFVDEDNKNSSRFFSKLYAYDLKTWSKKEIPLKTNNLTQILPNHQGDFIAVHPSSSSTLMVQYKNNKPSKTYKLKSSTTLARKEGDLVYLLDNENDPSIKVYDLNKSKFIDKQKVSKDTQDFVLQQ